MLIRCFSQLAFWLAGKQGCARAAVRVDVRAAMVAVFFSLLLSVWMLGSGKAFAQAPATVAQAQFEFQTERSAKPETDLKLPDADVFVDNQGTLGVDAVTQRFNAGQGSPVVTAQVMPTSDGRAVWYRLRFFSEMNPEPLVLTLPHPGLDTADFYWPAAASSANPQWIVQRSGDQRPVADWPIRNLYPAFSLTPVTGEATTAYLRVTNIYPVSINWSLSTANSFYNAMKNWYVLLGIYIGLAILIVAVSCIQAVTWREPICYFYAGYVSVVALAQLSLTGLGGEYLWPHLGWWNDRSLSTLALLSSTLLHLFLRRLLADRELPRMAGALLFMALLGGVLMLGSLAPDRTPYLRFFGLYYMLALLTYLCVAGWYAWRRPRVGLWVLAGVLCLTGGAVAPVMRLFGMAPTTLATQYGAQGGAALQIPLLMVGLYFRSREKRASQVRVGALARVDPLTGVASHGVLLQRLKQLLERQKRTPEGAILRVRLNNAEAIRKEHGLAAAQTAVVQVGALITKLAREGDTVARHSQGDLVWILQGPINHSRIIELAQSLIARALADCPGLPPGSALHLKIALTSAPFSPPQAVLLMGAMGNLLTELSRRPGTGLKFMDHSVPQAQQSGQLTAAPERRVN